MNAKGEESITAWITRYALTQGIFKVHGTIDHNVSSKMISWGAYNFAHNNDWHRTPEAALARAEEMRRDKVASLRKRIDKFESLKFEAQP